MVTRAQRIADIDAFMAARKGIVRSDGAGQWRGSGGNPDEREIQWPLEIGGEQVPDAFLKVIGWLGEPVFFRLLVLRPMAVCRLDYTEETHTNPAPYLPGMPPLVVGAHHHTWPINRHLFTLSDPPVELSNAVAYDGPRTSFDSILRWFCAGINIEQPPPGHLIDLPRREMLF